MQNENIQLKNDQTCLLRQPQEEDAQSMLDYLNLMCTETDFICFGKGEVPWNLEDKRKFIKEHLDDDNKLIIVAEISGSIVGIASFTGGKPKRIQHIGEFGITVLRQYWHSGIGRILTGSIIEWAKISGVVRKIFLKVRVDNQRAINLYKNFGFTIEGTISRQLLIGEKFYDAYYMGLNIDP